MEAITQDRDETVWKINPSEVSSKKIKEEAL